MKQEFKDEAVEVMVWMNAKRQGKKKDGSFNAQRELQAETMNIKELLTRFRKLLTICLPHCQEIRWIREMISLDFQQLWANTLLVFTDFAAVMALCAF